MRLSGSPSAFTTRSRSHYRGPVVTGFPIPERTPPLPEFFDARRPSRALPSFALLEKHRSWVGAKSESVRPLPGLAERRRRASLRKGKIYGETAWAVIRAPSGTHRKGGQHHRRSGRIPGCKTNDRVCLQRERGQGLWTAALQGVKERGIPSCEAWLQ